MKKNLILIVALAAACLAGVTAKAQDDSAPLRTKDPDFTVLAGLLLDEKGSGNVDNAPFATYFDSLGYVLREDSGRWVLDVKPGYEDSRSFEAILTKADNGQRIFKVFSGRHELVWKYVVRLQDFGLVLPGKHPTNLYPLDGKGLWAVAVIRPGALHEIAIGYGGVYQDGMVLARTPGKN